MDTPRVQALVRKGSRPSERGSAKKHAAERRLSCLKPANLQRRPQRTAQLSGARDRRTKPVDPVPLARQRPNVTGYEIRLAGRNQGKGGERRSESCWQFSQDVPHGTVAAVDDHSPDFRTCERSECG